MSERTIRLKPLFLSEDEALALLDLCLLSSAETDPAAECALMKLSGLARQFVAESLASENAARLLRADPAVVPAASNTARKPILYTASYLVESWMRLTAGRQRVTLPPCDQITPS